MTKKIIFLTLVFAGISSLVLALDENIKAEAKTHYEKGNILYQQGKFPEAQQEYQRALELMKQSETVKTEKFAAGDKPSAKIEENVIAIKEKAQEKSAVIEYTISEEDVLKISVWQNPDLDQEVIVRPDGMISFPLVGDVLAKGLSIPQLDREITRLLSEFVRSPEVSISLKKIGGSKVIVLGEIMRPGVYSVTGSKTVLEAIGQSGGFSRDAVPSSIVLVRGGLIKPQPQRLNLSKVLKGQQVQQQNIALQAEDIIFVPKKFIADLNYFLGQVLDPISKGAYTSKELKSY